MAGDLSREGANYLGKLRSNFVGTEFEIFDNGHNPKVPPPARLSLSVAVPLPSSSSLYFHPMHA